ncbi:hypothetical protein B0H14DRAFT_2416782, partial [Mycena olivaceomarginata]
ELKGVRDQSIGMLAVAFAILLTTIILAKGAGGDQTITGYHAAVVLDLSWMNNTSTWIWFILYVHHRSKRDGQPTGVNWSDWWKNLIEPLRELLGWNEGAGDSTGLVSADAVGASPSASGASPNAYGALSPGSLSLLSVPSISRSWPPLEYGCGAIHLNLASP